VGSKSDLGADEEGVCDLVISAATREGLRSLAARLAGMVAEAREKVVAAEAEPEIVVHRPLGEGVQVQRAGPTAWLVLGRAAERAVALSDLTDDGAQAEAVRRLRRLGVDRALSRAGAREGDDVTVGDMTFTWEAS
jgi:GTPase